MITRIFLFIMEKKELENIIYCVEVTYYPNNQTLSLMTMERRFVVGLDNAKRIYESLIKEERKKQLYDKKVLVSLCRSKIDKESSELVCDEPIEIEWIKSNDKVFLRHCCDNVFEICFTDEKVKELMPEPVYINLNDLILK